MTSDSAIALCRATLTQGSRSFALATRLLPRSLTDRVAVLYTWCRTTDDAVDLAPPSEQSAALARLTQSLHEIYAGVPQSDVTLSAFQTVRAEARIPELYPQELVRGMAMDVAFRRYQRLEHLLEYCYCVAATVGLMTCHLCGVRGTWALRHAAHLGMAMQLTNIARDVREDWHRGRLYLPEEWLADVGLEQLGDHLGGPLPYRARAPLALVLERLRASADRFYRSGEAGIPALDLRSALAVRTASLLYAAIGDELGRRQHNVFGPRAVVAPAEKLRLVLRAAKLTAAELPTRLQQPFRSAPITQVLRFPEDILPL